MDPRQLEALAHRLADNANDTEALNAAYAYGQTDPRAYATFLEKTAAATPDGATGAHWYCESANVWLTSLSDAHRAERALSKAIERDPLHVGALERLVGLYREKSNTKAVLTLHQRRAKTLEKLQEEQPEFGPHLAEVHSEIGRIYLEELSQPDKAVIAYQKAVQCNPEDVYAIYQARELLKTQNRFKETLPLFDAEIRLVSGDPERQMALYVDQIAVCRELGDTQELKRALRGARAVDSSDDPGLKQQLAAAVLEEVQSGANVPAADRTEAEELFVSLAETYDGEYGHSYAICALGLNQKNDRAAQLAMYYAEAIGKSLETATTIAGYLAASPSGLVAEQARDLVARALSAGGGDELIVALTPADSAPAEVKAAAFGLIARSLSQQGKKPDALHYFKKVAQFSPGDEEAVLVLAEHYKGRDDRALRDLLQNATRNTDVEPGRRYSWLKELAELCEGRLGDVEGAIEARHQLVLLDPSDEEAADQLESVLGTAGKWDDLAALITRRAQGGGDPQLQVERELRAADIHLTKRKDRLAAAEALTRAARIEPDEQERAFSAVDLWVEAGKTDAAIALLIGLLKEILEDEARAAYNRRLAVLLEQVERWTDAGGAYAEAASLTQERSLWAEAERCFKEGEAWEQAAQSVLEQQQLTPDHVEKSKLSALRATYLERLGDSDGMLEALVEALSLNPRYLEVSKKLEHIYEREGRYQELVDVLMRRAEVLHLPEDRADLRKRAGFMKREQLRDEEGMRACLLLVLDDVEDRDVLLVLADDAENYGHGEKAIGFLRRLAEASDDKARVEIALRLSRLLEDAGDEEGALEQYEMVLVNHPDRRDVLAAVAQLRRSLGNAHGAAEAYARLVEVSEGDQKLSAARIWAEILAELGQKNAALAAYAVVLSLDREDYEVVALARDLAEEASAWEQFVEYQQELVDLEGDEDDGSEMVRKLADVYENNLKRPADAMRVLVPFVKQANVECRQEYERIGKSLKIELEVAQKIFTWMTELGTSAHRTLALKSAYQTFVKEKADDLAVLSGIELVSMRDASEELAASLEEVGTRAKHLEALRTAFRVLGQELSGPARAEEMVRQAEVLHEAGSGPTEAVEHGEQALTSIGPDAAEPLLARLAKIAGAGDGAVLVYERQVARCKSATERLYGLCRAAEVAHEQGQDTRVKQFLDLAIVTAGSGEGLSELRDKVGDMDLGARRNVMRQALVRSLADSGKNTRDGGKSRAEFLALGASIAYEELKDDKLAYSLLTQALIAHATDEYLKQLIEMGEADRDLKKATDAITIALEHVSDGPMVRLLLRRRFELYAGPLDSDEQATEDLKRLYELSPADAGIASELETRYEAANDHRGLVKLYEDQILRGRDKKERAELARKVAVIWQDTLVEPREAADAWRRVLRMNSGDQEAKDGLERAKTSMRRVSAQEIIAGEEQTRIEVAKQKVIEEVEAKRRAEALQAKAAELKARHSQPPPPLDLEDEGASDAYAAALEAASSPPEEDDEKDAEQEVALGHPPEVTDVSVQRPGDEQDDRAAEEDDGDEQDEQDEGEEPSEQEPDQDDEDEDERDAERDVEDAEPSDFEDETPADAAPGLAQDEAQSSGRASLPPPLPPAALAASEPDEPRPRFTAADLFDAEETPLVDHLVEELMEEGRALVGEAQQDQDELDQARADVDAEAVEQEQEQADAASSAVVAVKVAEVADGDDESPDSESDATDAAHASAAEDTDDEQVGDDVLVTEEPESVEPVEQPVSAGPPPLPGFAGTGGSSLPPPLPPRARPATGSGIKLPPPASLPPGAPGRVPPPPPGTPSRRPPPPPPAKSGVASVNPLAAASVPPPPPGAVSRRPPPPPPGKKS